MAKKKSSRKARPSAPKFCVRTMTELAELFGVSYDQVKKWKAWLPEKKSYGWDFAEIARIKIKRMEESSQMNKKQTAELVREKMVEETMKIREQRLALEDDRAVRRGESFNADDLSRQHALAIAKVRRQLMQCPDMVANMVPGQYKAAVKRQTHSHLFNCLATLQDEKWLRDKTLRMILIEEAEKVAPEMGIELVRKEKRKRRRKGAGARDQGSEK